MRILFVGVDGYENIVPGLRRLGHDVVAVDPFAALPNIPFQLSMRWAWKTGGFGLERLIQRYVLGQAGSATYDLALVLRGDLIGPDLVQRLPAKRVVNFNNDHPFSPRDGNRWRLFRRTVGLYDLFVSPRQVTLDNARAAGAKDTLKVFLWADEIMHRPVKREAIPEALRSEVAFVGTWMPERGPFMKRLLDRGVPLTIFGGGWWKAPEFSELKRHIHLGALNPTDYVQAVAGSRIALAMLSKGNADLHTRRSNEIPALGRLLCGERTSDHVDMYEEGVEAVFWSSADECADVCLALLADPARLDSISALGHARCIKNGYFTQPTLQRLLDAAVEKGDSPC